MSEPKILLFGCGHAGADPERCLALVEQIAIPADQRLVLSSGKFDARKRARTLNIEAGYPAAMIAFQNRFRLANDRDAQLHFEDGFDILSICENIDRLSGFEYLLLMRRAFKQPSSWSDMTEQMNGRHFLIIDLMMGSDENVSDTCNVLIDLRDSERLFLLALRDIFETGTAFAIEPYSFQKVLDIAADAVGAVARSAGDR